jgi:hypothetical protein
MVLSKKSLSFFLSFFSGINLLSCDTPFGDERWTSTSNDTSEKRTSCFTPDRGTPVSHGSSERWTPVSPTSPFRPELLKGSPGFSQDNSFAVVGKTFPRHVWLDCQDRPLEFKSCEFNGLTLFAKEEDAPSNNVVFQSSLVNGECQLFNYHKVVVQNHSIIYGNVEFLGKPGVVTVHPGSQVRGVKNGTIVYANFE